MTAVQPDHASAVVAYLRRSPAVLGFTVPSRIVMHIPGSADMPANWIVVAAAGGRGQIAQSPYQHARVDVHVYGSTEFEAMRGARIVAGVLCPPYGSRRIVEQGCCIADTAHETALMALQTPREGWPFVVGSYGLTVLMEALA